MLIALHAAALVPLLFAARQDWKSKKISDRWCALILGAAAALASWKGEWLFHIKGFLVIGIPLLLYATAVKNGVGGGDVKLSAAVGALVGAGAGIGCLFFSLLLLVVHLKIRREQHGAFAPYLFVAYFSYFVISVSLIFMRR